MLHLSISGTLNDHKPVGPAFGAESANPWMNGKLTA